MKITANLEHAAMTPSGCGTESWKVYQSNKVPGMWCLRVYPQPLMAGTTQMIEIWMDRVTAINLGIITQEQYDSGE